MLEFHLGNLYVRINKKVATKEELSELHNILSVKTEGYYFSPQFRRGLWDGYKRFFNLLTASFYSGLLLYAASKLTSKFSIIDDRISVLHQNNPLSLIGIELRDYQIRMIEEAIKAGRGIISAPPNSGKTECAAGIIQILGLPAIFFTHRLKLLHQTRDRFEKRLGIKVGLVGGGIEEWEDITIVSIQTAYRKLDQFKSRFKDIPLVFADECIPAASQILLTTDISVPISIIVEMGLEGHPNRISEVLSYNLDDKVYEKKKILRYIKKCGYSPLMNIILENGISLKCTSNHKIYTKNRGYILAGSLKIGDELIFNESNSSKKSVCRICGKLVYNLGGHISSFHHVNNFAKYRRIHGSSSKRIEVAKKISESKKKRYSSEKGMLLKQISSERMKINNPSFIPDVHTCKIKEIKYRANNKKPKYVYNLEIEDNHNYFANSVLVSNCHHIASKSFEKCLKTCVEAYYKFGLSATALLRDDISNLTVRGLMGDEIITVTNQELISTGVSALPSVYLLTVDKPVISNHYTFDQAYEKGIFYNEYRNGLIISSVKRFLSIGKSVFILVWRIPHGELLLDMLRERGIESEFIKGGSIDHTDSVLERFENKELKCVVSSTISDEGLDIPAVDVLVIATGFKAPLKTVQRVGRGLRRKLVGANVVTIIDFIDFSNSRYLLKHSKERCRTYVKMGIKIFEVVENDWNNVIEI